MHSRYYPRRTLNPLNPHCTHVSESDWPYHDMSSNVTMLNGKTFHKIWWHLTSKLSSALCHQMSWNVFQFNMVTFDDKWRHLMIFREISCHEMSFNLTWWHLMTNGDIWWYSVRFHDIWAKNHVVYHDISWHVMIWPLLIQKGSAKMDQAFFKCRKWCMSSATCTGELYITLLIIRTHPAEL